MNGTMLRAPGAWILLVASLLLGGWLMTPHVEGWVARGLDLQRVMDGEKHRGESFDADRTLIGRRAERRLEVARAAVRGEITLKEAAARFQELDRWPPVENWSVLRRQYPNLSGEEFACLTVIEFTRNHLVDRDSSLARDVVRNQSVNTPVGAKGLPVAGTDVAEVIEGSNQAPAPKDDATIQHDTID